MASVHEPAATSAAEPDAPSAHELLEQAWTGEVLGEAFFVAAAGPLPEQQDTWALLARLERTTGALVAPVARAHGVTIDATTAAAQGAQFGEAASDVDATIEGSLSVAAQFLGIYEQLGELLPPAEAWLSQELVTHEHALVACLEGLRDGRDGSAEVRAFLQHHERR